MKTALITGITGQDGSYLAEFLLKKGYTVYGIVRRASTFNRGRLESIYDEYCNPDDPRMKLYLLYGDLCDSSSLNKIMRKVMPDEVYNLGAQSHVRVSFEIPEYTADVVGIGTLRLLEAIRTIQEDSGREIRFYQASSSELFGRVQEAVQRETTPFYPRSPYAVAKLYAYWITVNYREAYGIHASNGILFNHESPRRGENFVTKKIAMGVAGIKKGVTKRIYLGNLDAKRDWGYAGDYVEAMWLMLQQEKPDDYVIATGETHSVREFLELAFEYAGIPVESNGKSGLEEKYIRTDTGEVVVEVNSRYFRPTEVDILRGDSAKARKILGWKPKTSFEELVRMMVEYELRQIE